MAFAPLPPFYTYLTYTQRHPDPNAGYTTAKGEKEAAVAVNEAAKASRFD